MNFLSAISIIACIVYLHIGFYAVSLEKDNKTNRLFMFFCIAMAIWSFAYAFYYLQNDDQYIWIKISAIGWCTFSSFILHLVLIFTENKLSKKRFVKISLYIPSAIFLYMSVFLFTEKSKPSILIENFFYVGDFVYNFSFLLTSIILIGIWGFNSDNVRKRKQSRLIVLTSTIPFLLDLLTQNILPVIGFSNFPLMGHLYSLIMIFGVYYAMIKYRLFAITPKLLMEELLQEMIELVIIVLPNGEIIKTNDSTERLLGYEKNELNNKQLNKIFSKQDVDKILFSKQDEGICRLEEVYCMMKDGSKVPINISCSYIIDPIMKDILGTVIVGYDISMLKKLEKEIDEHKKAEEYILYMANHDSLTGLPNRKNFYQLLDMTIKRLNNTDEKFAVVFLDLDDLKLINDSCGHEAGDTLLKEVGKRALGSIKNGDVAARIGGDEFTFIILDIDGREDALQRADELLKNINRSICILGKNFNICSSIGVSIFPDDGSDLDLLVKKADHEMYLMKKEKKLMQGIEINRAFELMNDDSSLTRRNVRSTKR